MPNNFDLKFKLNICDLDKFCLSNRKYITINNSVDSNTKNDFCHTKLMTDEQFNLLIDKLILVIKKKYNFDIVILGPVMAKLERKDVIDLRGKCSFGEFCSILKYSALHIGPEGGMIHMRKAFGTGPCCVWFGPTSPEIYGYDSNINFDYCSIHNCHCEWLINSWNKCCCVSEKKENCKKIKEMPLDVFVDEIRKKMESNIIKLEDI